MPELAPADGLLPSGPVIGNGLCLSRTACLLSPAARCSLSRMSRIYQFVIASRTNAAKRNRLKTEYR